MTKNNVINLADYRDAKITYFIPKDAIRMAVENYLIWHNENIAVPKITVTIETTKDKDGT